MAKAKSRRRVDPLAKKLLPELVRKNPRVLEVMHDHGVSFCAGCYLTLTSPMDRVAAYHAVPDLETFLADIKKALRKGARHSKTSN